MLRHRGHWDGDLNAAGESELPLLIRFDARARPATGLRSVQCGYRVTQVEALQIESFGGDTQSFELSFVRQQPLAWNLAQGGRRVYRGAGIGD